VLLGLILILFSHLLLPLWAGGLFNDWLVGSARLQLIKGLVEGGEQAKLRLYSPVILALARGATWRGQRRPTNTWHTEG